MNKNKTTQQRMVPCCISMELWMDESRVVVEEHTYTHGPAMQMLVMGRGADSIMLVFCPACGKNTHALIERYNRAKAIATTACPAPFPELPWWLDDGIPF